MKRKLVAGLVMGLLMLGGRMGIAAPLTFDFTYDGASFGNSARAVGSITFEDSLLANTYSGHNNFEYFIGGLEILDLSVKITGASQGNGYFGMSDFSSIYWQTNGVLDFSRQLVGQPTHDQPWGTSDNFGGDFNLFGQSVGAPAGTWYFRLTSQNGDGENMALISMSPSAVPEPATMLLFGTGIVSLVGIGLRRKKQ